jgi:tetratricopeptide (TPR) repeat protein
MDEDWNQALEYARRFLNIDGRENAGRLRVGLLSAEILLNMDRKKEALTELRDYFHNTRNEWYRLISECLLEQRNEKSLAEKAGESPEYMLTGHVALAFWAEGSGDKNKAIDHYREALGSYMDDMIEYVFAVERIKRLRQKS